MTSRWKQYLPALIVLLAALSVFVLPFVIPPPVRDVMSVSNSAGFNNRVAGVSAALISLLSFSICWRFRIPAEMPSGVDYRPMSRSFVLTWSFGVAAVATLCILMIYRAHVRYVTDYGYFIGQMSSAADYGRKLYSEIEFPYGPALFYPPIWIRGLFHGCAHPLAAAYCVIYIAQEAGGLLLLAYVMQRLPIERQLRRALFVAFALFSLSGGFGVNYTYFRFVAPLAIFLFSLRGRRLAAAAPLLFLGQLITLGISPEIGFGFGCGVVAYAVLRAFRREFCWLATLLIPIAGLGLFLLLAGKDYLLVLSLFARGAYNLVVEPQLFMLIYLFSLVWLVPAGLAGWWREQREYADLLLGLYGIGLALVPVALGRADVGHVFYNGLGILLLGLVLVSTWRYRVRVIWILMIFAVVMTAQRVDFMLYRTQLRYVVTAQLARSIPYAVRYKLANTSLLRGTNTGKLLSQEHIIPPQFDAERVRQIVGNSKVIAPRQIPLEVEEALRKYYLYRPGYYLFGAGVFGRTSEEKEIIEVNRSSWALLPSEKVEWYETLQSSAFILGFPFPYEQRHPPYVVGRLFLANLETNWHPVATIDSYTLYRRNW